MIGRQHDGDFLSREFRDKEIKRDWRSSVWDGAFHYTWLRHSVLWHLCFLSKVLTLNWEGCGERPGIKTSRIRAVHVSQEALTVQKQSRTLTHYFPVKLPFCGVAKYENVQLNIVLNITHTYSFTFSKDYGINTVFNIVTGATRIFLRIFLWYHLYNIVQNDTVANSSLC